MLNIAFIRETPTVLDDALVKRGAQPASKEVLDIDEKRRGVMATLQKLQSKRNDISKAVGMAKSKGEPTDNLLAEMTTLKNDVKELEEKERALTEKFEVILAALPNIPAEDVPTGKDENDNVELMKWGTPKEFSYTPKAHYDLGEALGYLDFETGAKLAGARFVWMQGPLARLERALAMFFLNTLTEDKGFTEVCPPLMVNTQAMFGTSQLPKFEDDQFLTTDGRWIIPTAEVPLTNYGQNRTFKLAELPLKFTAHTPCFRKEAGSAGRDTRGLIRMHQFEKIEMVQLVDPEKSAQAHEEMTACAEELLQKLELPYRKVILCTGDLGFGARKTYDLEVWLPSQNTYREISSCSNCGDFQARRMKAKYKDENGKNQYLHTLNGSALALGRALVAIMENYQNEDGSITVPDILVPYMGGLTVIK